MAAKRKRGQSDASKIRALHAAGASKEEILAKGFSRQQRESALAHTKSMGRPRKPRCPLCGSIVQETKTRSPMPDQERRSRFVGDGSEIVVPGDPRYQGLSERIAREEAERKEIGRRFLEEQESRAGAKPKP